MERDLVFPALLGRDINRWSTNPQLVTIVPNRAIIDSEFMRYDEMKKQFPLTYAYFRQFWDILAEKEDYWTYFAQVVDNSSDAVLDKRHLHWRRVNKARRGGVRKVVQASGVPLYSISKIGPYTFQPYRVVWPRMASNMTAAVISDFAMPVGRARLQSKTVIPNDVVTLVGFESEEEAHYFCACMNSKLVRQHLLSFSSPGRGFAPPSILENIAIPKFVHAKAEMVRLSKLSKQCHDLAGKMDGARIEKLEKEIDELVWKLWSS